MFDIPRNGQVVNLLEDLETLEEQDEDIEIQKEQIRVLSQYEDEKDDSMEFISIS